MSERTILEAQKELESLAARLIEKYPDGHLSEIEVAMPHCGIAIRAPVKGLDTPRAIVQGSYQELRAFEITYQRMRAGA